MEQNSLSSQKTDSMIAGQKSPSQTLSELSRQPGVDLGKAQAEQFKSFTELLSGKKAKTATSPRLAALQDLEPSKPATGMNSGTVSTLTPSTKSLPDTRVAFFPIMDVAQDSALAAGQAASQQPAQDVAQLAAFDTRQDTRQDFGKFLDPFDGPGRGDEPEEELFPKRKKKKEDNKKKKAGFVLEVKRGGKFLQVGEESDLATVAEKGVSFVQDTSARSFRIRTADGQQVRPAEFGSFLPADMFRASKTSRNIVVEKSRYAINTGGERSEITNVGIMASKRKANSLFGR